MALPIVVNGATDATNNCADQVLHQQARLLTTEEIHSTEIQQLIQAMIATMRNAPGVGLAAPQIGKPLQLFVMEDRAEYTKDIAPEILAERGRHPVELQVVINPTLTIIDPTPQLFFEGCLSVSGSCRIVPRAKSVRVNALNAKAEPITVEYSGWPARILQHEYDHLQGQLYIDFAPSTTAVSIEDYRNIWLHANAQQIKDFYNKP